MDRSVQQTIFRKIQGNNNKSYRRTSFQNPITKFPTNLVVVGDLIHEIVAREVALKISETTYLPVRSFGLEQFLHEPRVTLDRLSNLIIFSSLSESRIDTLINCKNCRF